MWGTGATTLPNQYAAPSPPATAGQTAGGMGQPFNMPGPGAQFQTPPQQGDPNQRVPGPDAPGAEFWLEGQSTVFSGANPPPTLSAWQTFWGTWSMSYPISPYAPKGYPGWGPGALFQPAESTFYTRADYYHWTETAHGKNLLDEQGPLYTVGYTRTGGEQRLRVELFGGVVSYHGQTFGGNQTLYLNNQTTYYGGRIEYDLFFNMPNYQNGLWFLGLGTRLWHRSLPSTTVDGTFVQGYGETWVTLYPYIGIETRHDPTRVCEFYGRTRIGITAYTHNHAGSPLNTGVQPLAGPTALLEEGIRWTNFSVSAWVEVFGFYASHSHNDLYQPTSTLLTLGAKAAYSF